MEYPVAERALKKWAAEKLESLDSEENREHYRFLYEGSTCNNGGAPFQSFFHVRIGKDQTIEQAWIDIPADQEEAACLMCASPSHKPEEAREFIDGFRRDADCTGMTLEAAIQEEQALNFAGCLCYKAMVHQKWKMALSTIHYALTHT